MPGLKVAQSRWVRKIGLGLAAGVVVLVASAVATAPPALVNRAKAPSISGEVDDWLARRESAAASKTPLVEGTDKRIRWFGGRDRNSTRHSLVYLHGFSATRKEISPVAELVADALGANLFETRLSGHGLQASPLAGVRAEDWLDDAAEALAIGNALGESVIVMGTSTGATLALAMVHHPSFARVCCLVLISPNIALRDSNTELLTWPGGPQLAYMVAGDTRSWTTSNKLQERYWATTYPMDAVVEMMRLVKSMRALLPMEIEQSLLVFYSPRDRVVDPEAITTAFGQINASRKQIIPITESGDPSNHVIAGDILSPQNNEMVAQAIVRFIRAESQ